MSECWNGKEGRKEGKIVIIIIIKKGKEREGKRDWEGGLKQEGKVCS